MFQLIVAVISIALVAALAIASIYYGGAAFTKSSLRANVTTLVNAGQQIAGAVALYKTDYTITPDMQMLKDGGEYLSAEPGKAPFVAENAAGEVASWYINGDVAEIAIDATADICGEVERQAGEEGGQFACANGATSTGADYFQFKL